MTSESTNGSLAYLQLLFYIDFFFITVLVLMFFLFCFCFGSE